MVGRPTDCTPDVQHRILTALRSGLSMMAAATVGGIHDSTLHEWVRRGKAGEQPFADFAQQVQMARQSGLLPLENAVLKGGLKNPKVALAILRARNPKEWGGVQKHEVSGPDGGPVTVVGIDPRTLTDEQLKTTLRALGVSVDDEGP